METINTIKTLLISILISITAYLQPIAGEMQSLLYVFGINFIFGLLAAIISNKEGFSFKKAWRCIWEATVLFILICSLYYIGERKGDEMAALQCVSFVSYAVIYFYIVNILRNAKFMLKEDTIAYKVIHFLHFVISVEFVKKIPYLSNYLNTVNEKKEEDHV